MSGRLLLAAGLALAVLPSAADAQEWRATAQMGRVTQAATPAGAGGSSSFALGVSRTGLRDRIALFAGLPVDGDPFWAVLSGWTRLDRPAAVSPILDLSAHGFVQRTTVTEAVTPPAGPLPIPGPGEPIYRDTDVSGHGLGGEALAGLRARAGAVALELRGGAAAQRSELADATASRVLPTADARVTLFQLPLTLGGELRGWWHDAERHAYAGGTLHLVEGPVQLWGGAGRWIDGGVDELAWSAGAQAALGGRLELHAAVRGNAFDPLYLTATETTFSLGASVRFGRGAAARAPVPARYEDGRAEIRLSADEVAGTPSIAGDFTGWKPVPMRRDGSHWTWEAALAPGVYEYAFVRADGTWFVPESVAGRKDDGMGGHVAVLVVAA